MGRRSIDVMSGDGYWYDASAEGTQILAALRRFRAAEEHFRRQLVREMGMNITDVVAIRHVMAAEQAGAALTPRDLADRLEISTASVTTLLDRLAGYGHLDRVAHPTDRRKVVVRATAHAHEEVRTRLAAMHEEMARIAAAVPPHCRDAVVGFLDAMAGHFAGATGPADHDPAGT